MNKPDLKIDSMFAFVACEEDGEGIMGAEMMVTGRRMFMPLVGADMARIKSLYKYAEQISKESGMPFKIYRFDNKVDITEEVKGEI